MRYFKTRITDGGASGNRGASLFPEGRTYSPPAMRAAVWPAAIVRSPRGMRLLRKPLDNAAFLRNCHHCPRSRLFCSISKIVVRLILSLTTPPTACENSAQNNPSDMFGSFVAAITLT